MIFPLRFQIMLENRSSLKREIEKFPPREKSEYTIARQIYFDLAEILILALFEKNKSFASI